MFDKKIFKFLIEKAMDNRKITQYAEDSGVNRTYLSKYINQRLDSPPTPDILKRLSNASCGIVSYEEFMEAAGYIDNNITKDIKTHQEYIINNGFGEKLKRLRIDKNMTQQELAKILKISSSTIGMYEQNRRSPDIETLKLIADYFQCSTDYLLGKNDIENMNRLSLLRKSHNMSQAELAEKLGVTQQTISKYENGNREPDTETLKLLSSIFNVSIDYLLGGTDIRNHDNAHITPKEHENIEEVVEELRERLLKTQNFKIEGKPATKEDIETILDSVKVGIEMAKIKKRRSE